MIKEVCVSVIIPVYNSGKDIYKTVDSILNQTFENYEIIIINDGSTDETSKYLKEIQKKDERIIIFEQKNQGVSIARNQGIFIARGKYIAFIDSGDLYKKDYLERMIFSAEEKEYELVSCGYICGKHNNTWKEEGEFLGREFHNKVWELSKQGTFNACWNKLFLRSIIEQYNVKFPVGQAMGEDLNFVLQYALHINSCKLLKECLYEYVVNMESATHKAYKAHWVIEARNTILIWHKYCEKYGLDKAKVNGRVITSQILACMKVASSNSFNITKSVSIEVIKNEEIRKSLFPIECNFFVKNIGVWLIKNEKIIWFCLICRCGGLIRRIKRYINSYYL